jgi:hypothetical protein
MSTIGYMHWGIIPLEEDVLSGTPTAVYPPMLSNLALDRGASIFLRLDAASTHIQIEIGTTAVSAPSAAPPFTLFTGVEDDTFQEVPATWNSRYDGAMALFNSEIEMIGPFLKIHNGHPKSIIVTSVTFSQVTAS